MTPKRTYLPSINTLVSTKAEIQSLCLKYEPLLSCAESLKGDKIKSFCL